MCAGVVFILVAGGLVALWWNDLGWGFACAAVPFVLLALADLALLLFSGAIGFYWRDRSIERS